MQHITKFNKLKDTYGSPVKLLSGLVILFISGYFIFHALHFFEMSKEVLGKYFNLKWFLLFHISGGSLALLTGPFQFWEEFRNRNLRVHRLLGKIYVISVLISGLCAGVLSATTAFNVNGAYAFSLQVWALVWLISTVIAYHTVRLKKIKLHKEWMVRSYVVSLAFVMSALLLKIPIIASLGDFANVSTGLFWLSWSVPLFIYDIVLSYQRKQ